MNLLFRLPRTKLAAVPIGQVEHRLRDRIARDQQRAKLVADGRHAALDIGGEKRGRLVLDRVQLEQDARQIGDVRQVHRRLVAVLPVDDKVAAGPGTL